MPPIFWLLKSNSTAVWYCWWHVTPFQSHKSTELFHELVAPSGSKSCDFRANNAIRSVSLALATVAMHLRKMTNSLIEFKMPGSFILIAVEARKELEY